MRMLVPPYHNVPFWGPIPFRGWEERKLPIGRVQSFPLTNLSHIWYTFCMDRTVRIQLHPTPDQAKALDETIAQFTQAFNQVCAYGWEHQEKNGVRLHHETYRDTKVSCPGLVSDLLIQARVKATETLTSAFTWKKKHEASYIRKVEKAKEKGYPVPQFKPVKCPTSEHCPVRYNIHTYTLDWKKQSARMSTTSGKMSIPFTVPRFSAKYQGHGIATADLVYRNGKYWLHVVVKVPEPDIPPTEEVIGVDLGLNRPAVTSEYRFLGNRQWKETDRKYFRIRRKLQSKGSKSAKRHLKKLSKRQARFHRDCDHVLSKRIVQNTPSGATIVLENLKDIRENSKIGRGKKDKNVETKRRLHSWTFAQFYGFITYKAQERGIQVVKIDPRHTSQTCSQCGHQHRSNRKSQSLFLCKNCGYCLNADLNASINIKQKYLASLGTTLASGLPVMQPIVSTLRS
jgi:putative transposase